MNNPTNSAFIAAIFADGMQPCIVDEQSDNLLYVGYCLPTCTGEEDAKWLIKKIWKVGNIQKIYYANGSRLFNQKWEDRNTLTYKMSEYAES